MGWQLIADLQQRNLQLKQPIELIFSQANAYDLISHFANSQSVILVDAIVQANLPLGQICWWENTTPQAIPAQQFSTHNLGLSNILQLAQNIRQLPPQWIVSGIVVNPKQSEFNAKLSPEILTSITILLNIIESKLKLL